MIVSEDDGGRIYGQCLFDDFSRIDTGAVDGAPEKLIKTEHTVAVVEVQAAKDLVSEVLDLRVHECPGIGRAADGLAHGQRFRKVAPRKFRYRAQGRSPGITDALFCND